MAIEIKEYVDFKSSEPTKNNGIVIRESAAIAAPQQMISPDSLMVEIEGIHSDVLTINCTQYSKKCLENSIPYWTEPYEKAVIMHHNDEDGQIIGRVKKAEMIDSKRSGTAAINFTCNIGDESGIKGIKNGTLSTVSIGAVAYDVRCSICGCNVAESVCEHKKGCTYDDELCYWIVEDMEPREVSYVILPSDKYAQTMKVYKPGKKDLKESVEVIEEMSVRDELFKTITESVVEDEQVEVKEKVEVDEEVKEGKEEKKEDKVEKEEVKEEEKEEEKAEEEEEKEEADKDDDKDDKEQDKKDDEEEENKEEEESNKDDRDAIINELKEELKELKDELKEVKQQLKEAKKMKEAVELELAGYKVQEKVNVARKIKELKESIGIECEDAEEIAKNNSINELNLIYKTLNETCNYTKLPNKILMESIVDEDADNIKQHIELKESASNDVEEDYQDLLQLQNLHKRLFK